MRFYLGIAEMSFSLLSPFFLDALNSLGTNKENFSLPQNERAGD